MNDNENQPTMREILEFANKTQLSRFLDEIARNASAARDLIAVGDQESWDTEKLVEHVRVITDYANALPAELTKNLAGDIH
jgi:hypothetical protein